MNGMTREQRFCRTVLFGDLPTVTLPERDREAAEAVRGRIRRELAAPPFDRAKLLYALRHRAASSPAPISVVARPKPSARRIVSVAALLAIAVGLAWMFLRGPSDPAWAVPVPTLVAHRLPNGSWRYGDAATLTPIHDAQAAAGSDGVVVLRAGRAELVSDGQTNDRVEVLEALSGEARVSVLGPSRTGLRVLPGGRGLALSVYEGRANSVTLIPRAPVTGFGLGQNADGIFLLPEEPADTKGRRVILWPDVTAPLPPVTGGDVYLWLAQGHVVRGRVVASIADSIQFLRTAAPAIGTQPEISGKIPESLLAAEIAAWTPAETPRGRDAYARWLSECAPAQLLEAKHAWLWYLAEQEVGHEHAQAPSEFIATQRLLPETTMRLARRGDAPVLQLIPSDADLGPGWELNERGEVRPMTPDEPLKGQEF